MTLSKFQRLLRKINPKLRVRISGRGDVGGIFAGKSGKGGYIVRISKGELHLRGYRWEAVDRENPRNMIQGNIQKRGRKTLIMILRDRRWLRGHRDVSMLLWGIEREK